LSAKAIIRNASANDFRRQIPEIASYGKSNPVTIRAVARFVTFYQLSVKALNVFPIPNQDALLSLSSAPLRPPLRNPNLWQKGK
jgi:hypothetical protein